MNKKLLSFITSAVITASALPFTVSAEENTAPKLTKEEFLDLVISEDSDFSDGGFIYSDVLKFDAVDNQYGGYDLIVYGIDPKDVYSGSYHGSDYRTNGQDYSGVEPAMFFCGVTHMIAGRKDQSPAYKERFVVRFFVDNTIPGITGGNVSFNNTIVDASVNSDIDIAKYIYPVITSGDIDNDGMITASDATLVLQAYSYASTGANMNLNTTLFDYNKDGSINASDATDILEEYAARSTE